MSGHQDSSNRAPRARTGTAATAPTVAGGRVRGMAVGLWAVVGTLLGYGILTTAIKAAAPFG